MLLPKQRGRPALATLNGLLATNRWWSAVLRFNLLSKCVVPQSSRARLSRPKRLKVFGFGRVRPMAREAKAKLCLYLRNLRGCRDLSRSHFDVAEKLLFQFHNAASGRCFPSLESLARAAGCSVSTVQRAIRALEALKVLSWVHRLEWRSVEAPGLGVRRVPRRTSNGYQFLLPPSLLAASDGALGSPRAAARSVILRPGVAVPAVAPASPALDLLSPVEAALARWGAARSGAPS